MMDLDEAIRHCEEVAESKKNQVENGDWEKGSLTERDCLECASEHRQLAEWLKELKVYREQSGDAISREAAVNAIYDLCGENVSLKENPFRDNPHMDAVVDELENLPSVTPQQRTGRWIPVSERLPEERKKCLVTFRGGYVGIMCYASDLYRVDEYDFCDEKGMAGWFDYDRELGHYSRDDVIAWLPLPIPYKAESEVES